jgi:hypothetical protein
LDEQHEEIFWMYFRRLVDQHGKAENAEKIEERNIKWTTVMRASVNLSKVKIEEGAELKFGECWISECTARISGYPAMQYSTNE